ncbi:hypothetical protein BGZ80_010921 [Entomortierella chlamydospora]|uniref:Alpha/beta hydrolase fold-3 domain-containing protein n=1 Tax=Entomortierella chlamydospora TaxID=101097 RepID=A0A9P6MUY7_9FUNG|nr:hypothetical protein BGZ79_008498 [Entomortierella chlamydospora]KAG0013676.1 hypothetical protein BGZ80_010921 [Entomortierella chlamydospora]
MYLLGKTPPIPFSFGCTIAFASRASNQLSVNQKRRVFACGLGRAQEKLGLGTPEQRAQWATLVYGKPTSQHQSRVLFDDDPKLRRIADPRGPQGHTWKGYWIPFQEQVHVINGGNRQEIFSRKTEQDINQIKVGESCDLVVLNIHGGGFVDGFPLQTLGLLLKVMKQAHEKHNIKIGYLSVDYSLSPETPYPGALNECIEAYRSLVKEYKVDARRIVLGGESAGGNLALAMLLKLNAELKDELGTPAGVFTICPYFLDPEPMKHSIYDCLVPTSCQEFVNLYSQNRPEVLSSPYYSMLNQSDFSCTPPILVIFGGAEILRPSIERFVTNFKNGGGDVEVHLKEHHPHTWFLIDQFSTERDREEGRDILVQYLARIYEKRNVL